MFVCVRVCVYVCVCVCVHCVRIYVCDMRIVYVYVLGGCIYVCVFMYVYMRIVCVGGWVCLCTSVCASKAIIF